jgi:hypothetical protein
MLPGGRGFALIGSTAPQRPDASMLANPATPGGSFSSATRLSTGDLQLSPDRSPRITHQYRSPLLGVSGVWLANRNAEPRRAENEEDRAENAQRSPKMIETERGAHVEQRERCEYQQRNRLLQYLELRQAERCIPDAIRGDLEQILEERDCPRNDGYEVPRLRCEIAQMAVPRLGHERVRDDQEQCSLQCSRHDDLR